MMPLALTWCLYGCPVYVNDSSRAEEPRTLYVSACASCHGSTGIGDGPAAPALRRPPADLTQLSQRNGGVFPRTLVVDVVIGKRSVVAHGTREMPVWSQRFGPTSGATVAAAVVARRRLELIVDYVESLQVRSTP
jgi:mono/diheme cytochrome c family protein